MTTDSFPESGVGWRHHWFVKKVLAEIPIIGPFFTAKNISQAFHQAGKSTAMLVGGTAAMMLGVASSETEEDSMGLRMTKMTTNMAVGMACAGIAYNGLSSGGEVLCHYYGRRNSVPLSSPSEQQQSELLDRSLPKSNSNDHKI